MPVAIPSRLAAVAAMRARIFQTLPNPAGHRTGVKYLTRKLRSPLMANYYPKARPINFKELSTIMIESAKENGFEGRMLDYWEMPDLREEQRLEKLEYDRRRGKTPPKKGEGRRSTMKKKR